MLRPNSRVHHGAQLDRSSVQKEGCDKADWCDKMDWCEASWSSEPIGQRSREDKRAA